MSNKARRPEGYSDRTTQQINQEYNNIVGRLGQARAMELAAQRQQVEFENTLETLEKQFQVAQAKETRKAAEAQEKALKAKETPATEAPAPTAPSEEPFSASGPV